MTLGVWPSAPITKMILDAQQPSITAQEPVRQPTVAQPVIQKTLPIRLIAKKVTTPKELRAIAALAATHLSETIASEIRQQTTVKEQLPTPARMVPYSIPATIAW